jgi:hypothetical protein
MFSVSNSLIKVSEDSGAGVWITPSYMNHSCIDKNAFYHILGVIFIYYLGFYDS